MIKEQKINGSAHQGRSPVPDDRHGRHRREATRHLLHRDFTGHTIETILGPENRSMNEATRALGAALGMPDLPYRRVRPRRSEGGPSGHRHVRGGGLAPRGAPDRDQREPGDGRGAAHVREHDPHPARGVPEERPDAGSDPTSFLQTKPSGPSGTFGRGSAAPSCSRARTPTRRPAGSGMGHRSGSGADRAVRRCHDVALAVRFARERDLLVSVIDAWTEIPMEQPVAFVRALGHFLDELH